MKKRAEIGDGRFGSLRICLFPVCWCLTAYSQYAFPLKFNVRSHQCFSCSWWRI